MKNFPQHERAENTKTEWLTPPEIIKSLGEFDLDPCAPVNRPWDTAKEHFTIKDDGLSQEWRGRVFLNPPYGRSEIIPWMDKMLLHGDGISLAFARTDTDWFTDYVWNCADAVIFIKGRLRFYHVTGEPADSSAGAPSVLAAYGRENARVLQECSIEGKFVPLITDEWAV